MVYCKIGNLQKLVDLNDLEGSFHAKSPKKSKILTLTSSILLKIGI